MSENRLIRSLSKMSAFAGLLFLANCASYEIEELKNTPRSGSEFSRNLANEYQTFAQKEDAQSHEMDASHFAVKGLQAAAGENVLPEQPYRWDIHPSKTPDLIQKRHHLMAVMMKSGRRIAPKECAAAQVAYDCLVAHAESCGCEEIPHDMCENKFRQNLMAAEKAVQAVAPSFTVYFSSDKWDLNAENMKMVEAVAKMAVENKYVDVDVTGLTDAQGGRKQNLILSQKRAETVARALVNLGVEASRITALGAGEIAGVPIMPKNRKVIIHLY